MRLVCSTLRLKEIHRRSLPLSPPEKIEMSPLSLSIFSSSAARTLPMSRNVICVGPVYFPCCRCIVPMFSSLVCGR
ncbi:hypothetical protein M758_3G170500 [Ceratodon purpureus]|nr:hypothetical protein M758_3G170500 [Ceratodon purpureus]